MRGCWGTWAHTGKQARELLTWGPPGFPSLLLHPQNYRFGALVLLVTSEKGQRGQGPAGRGPALHMAHLCLIPQSHRAPSTSRTDP